MEAHLRPDRHIVCGCARCSVPLDVLRSPGIMQSLTSLTIPQRQNVLYDFRYQQERRVYEDLRSSSLIPGLENVWEEYGFVESRDVLLSIIHRFEAKIRSFSVEEVLIAYRGWQLWDSNHAPPLSLSRFLNGVLAPYVSQDYAKDFLKFERDLDNEKIYAPARTQRLVQRNLEHRAFMSWYARATKYPHVIVHFGPDGIATLEYSEDGVKVLYDQPPCNGSIQPGSAPLPGTRTPLVAVLSAPNIPLPQEIPLNGTTQQDHENTGQVKQTQSLGPILWRDKIDNWLQKSGSNSNTPTPNNQAQPDRAPSLSETAVEPRLKENKNKRKKISEAAEDPIALSE